MNAADTFKCKKMHISMYVGKCIRNQKEALEFWGPEASRFQSCPCDQGISIKTQMEGDMAKKGTCGNCSRPDMTIHSAGMCGGCVGRALGLEGEAREAALVQAKIDFQGRGNLVRKRGEAVKAKVHARRARQNKIAKVEGSVKTDPESGAIDTTRSSPADPKVEGTGLAFTIPTAMDNPSIISIMVNFTAGDHVLFDGLQALAKKYRRSPDQQILWLLEKELHNEHLVTSEKAVDHAA